jgi:hypothetical protein
LHEGEPGLQVLLDRHTAVRFDLRDFLLQPLLLLAQVRQTALRVV